MNLQEHFPNDVLRLLNPILHLVEKERMRLNCCYLNWTAAVVVVCSEIAAALNLKRLMGVIHLKFPAPSFEYCFELYSILFAIDLLLWPAYQILVQEQSCPFLENLHWK